MWVIDTAGKMGFEEFAEDYLSKLKQALGSLNLDDVKKVAELLLSAKQSGGQIFILGNGGSASTSSHFACDLGKGTLKNHYDDEEKRFRVVSLTDNVALLTAYANDLAYEDVFSQQLKNILREGDVVIAISASGNSPNVLRAVEFANKTNAKTVGFTGFDGGKLKEMVDLCVHVQSNHYGRVEDVHLILEHIITSYLASCKDSPG